MNESDTSRAIAQAHQDVRAAQAEAEVALFTAAAADARPFHRETRTTYRVPAVEIRRGSAAWRVTLIEVARTDSWDPDDPEPYVSVRGYGAPLTTRGEVNAAAASSGSTCRTGSATPSRRSTRRPPNRPPPTTRPTPPPGSASGTRRRFGRKTRAELCAADPGTLTEWEAAWREWFLDHPDVASSWGYVNFRWPPRDTDTEQDGEG